jgi:hypothetical protein
MQCEEWDDANSELFKESHDEAVHKNSYKSRLYELISASLGPKARWRLEPFEPACNREYLQPPPVSLLSYSAGTMSLVTQ